MVFKEMVTVRYSAAKERDMPLFRTLQWSWFVVAIFYTYGDFLHEFVLQHRSLLWLRHITMFNAWLSFAMYCCVFVVSVLTLKKGLYKYQVRSSFSCFSLFFFLFFRVPSQEVKPNETSQRYKYLYLKDIIVDINYGSLS